MYTSYEPWNALRNLQYDLSRLLDGDDHGNEDGSSIATSLWTPAVDIKEEDSQFVLKADVPGVAAKDIDITMENGLITIKGERRFEGEHGSNGYRRVERRHGTFYRRFSLPDYADAERISAKCTNGVLEVTVPKQQKAQPKRITVKS
jgi:HSP20 family protein